MGYLNDLATRTYEACKARGFHSGEPKVGDFCANLHGEVSELWEAYRNNTFDMFCNKAEKMIELGIDPPLSCAEEELADIIIRALDMAKAFNIDIDRAVEAKEKYNATRSFRHGGKKA